MPRRWHHLRILCTRSMLTVLFLASCATTQTTPREDYTYEMGRNCETPTTKLERVAPDGRYWIQARGDAGVASTEYPQFHACMKAQFQAHPYFDWLKAHRKEAVEAPLDRAKYLNAEADQLYQQARYGEAIPRARETLALREQALGPTHPDVAQSLNSLARLLQATGDYAGARPLYERALRIREEALGPTHLDVAQSLNDLAWLLQATGDYAGARPLYERALQIREQALGPTHPAVALSLNNLADSLRATGDYAGARPLYERARLVDLTLSRTSVELEDDELRGLRRSFGSQRALRRYVGLLAAVTR